MDEKRGSLDVARAVEHEHRAIAIVSDLDDLEAELAPAFPAPLVAQDHGQAGGEIAEALLAFAALGGNLEPGLPAVAVGAAGGRRGGQGKDGENNPAQREHRTGT